MPQTEHIKLHILVVNSNITGVGTGMVPRSLWDTIKVIRQFWRKVLVILPVKAEIVKRSFIVRLHRGLSNSKEIVLAYTECRVVEKVKLQPQEQAKSQDQ